MSRLTKDDIITGAGRRFATYGYHGTSMRDLGDDLGILGSSIYAHVGGKQELLVAVIERGAEGFDASAEAALADGDGPIDTLRRLIAGHIDVILDRRSEARTYLSETSFLEQTEHERVLAMRRGYERTFVEVIQQGIDDGAFSSARAARLEAIYVLSILNGIDRWFDDAGPMDRGALVDDVSGFVLEGLGAG